MPEFIGIAGDFMKKKALNRRLRAIMVAFVTVTVIIFVAGWLSGYYWGFRTIWGGVSLLAVCGLAIPYFKCLEKAFDKQLHLSRMEERGADAERDFVRFLEDLPDTYTVICDLDFADSYGNIDHLVIGPTGVFAIDVKRWSGTVASDGKGELLLNGNPTNKPQVRPFTGRTMNLRGRIKAVAGLEPYIQCIFAFLHTHVEAKWGTTGAVLCMRAEEVVGHIVKPSDRTPIPKADLRRLVRAAKALKELAAVQPHA